MRLDLSRIKWITVFTLVLFNLLAFQMFFVSHLSPLFSYIDEVAVLLILVEAVRRRVFVKSNFKPLIIALIVLSAFLVDGVVGNLINPYHQTLPNILADIIACLKFPIMSFVLMMMSEDGKSKASSYAMLLVEAKALCVTMVVTAIVSVFTDIGMSSTEIRYGLRGYIFIFDHPEVVNLLCVGLTVIFCGDFNRNGRWILLTQIPIVLTLRSKSFAFAAVVSLIFLAITKKELARRCYWPMMTFIALVAVLSVQHYYADPEQARAQLLYGGVKIANASFPFGLGFGSYGSAVTSTPQGYSGVYDALGFDSVYGLSRSYSAFVSDTFWPIILGQFGWLGLAIVIISISAVLKELNRRVKRNANPGYGMATAIVVFYLLISSMAGSAIFAPMSIYLVICLFFADQRMEDQISHEPAGPDKGDEK